MTALNKQALREAAIHAQSTDDWGCDDNNFHDQATPDVVLALLDELEAAEKAAIAVCNRSNHWKERAEAAEKRIAEHNFENQLLANADRDITALRQRIAELEARTVTVQLPADNAAESESPEDDATAWFDEGWNARGKADKEVLIAAGIGVKGE